MSWTKKQFVLRAFSEIGYASYIYDLMPEQLNEGLIRLDAMIATWNGQGIRIGYPLSDSPDNSDINSLTNVPDKANEAIYTNLAVRLGPPFGKTVSQETKQAANLSYKALLAIPSMPISQQYPDTLPSGAGNKTWRTNNQPFATTDDSLEAGPDQNIDF